MCFEKRFTSKAEAEEFAKGKIATRNRRVYKVLYGPRKDRKGRTYYPAQFQAFSYYRGFHYYQVGTRTTPAIGLRIWSSHFYPGEYLVIIKVGLHSYARKPELTEWSGGKVVVFILPKGARYWENDRGEIVSTELILY